VVKAMPEVYCPFTVRASPYADDAERFLVRSREQTGAGPELGTSGIGRLAGLAYPEASREALRIAALWFAFFWLFDEAWADRLPRHEVPRLGGVHRRVASVLAGARTGPGDDPAVRMLGLLGDAIAAWRPGWDTTAFHHEILRYLRATLWEVELRRRGAVPTLAEYLRMRPLTAAVPPSRELSFLLCDLRLDPVLRTHPAVQLAGAAAGDYSCWVNDLCSLETERGATMNLVFVAEREFGWARHRAAAWVATVARGEVETFRSVRESLPATVLVGVDVPGAAADLERYLSHYEGWFVASARWMPRTPRYRPVAEVAP
jgi:hypothetical protein